VRVFVHAMARNFAGENLAEDRHGSASVAAATFGAVHARTRTKAERSDA